MSLELRWVVIDTPDPKGLATFWRRLLDWPEAEVTDDYVQLTPPGGAGPRLLLYYSPDPKVGKNRAHVDLRADDLAAEVGRALDLGARRVDIGQGDARHAVLVDPEGNEFCIFPPD